MKPIIYTITAWQIVFCLIAVLYVYLRIYNKNADKEETAPGFNWHPFVLKFLVNYLPNIIQAFAGGVIFLGVANELGIEYVAKTAFSVDLGTFEKPVDITTAILSGLTGDFLLGKLINIVTKLSPNK